MHRFMQPLRLAVQWAFLLFQLYLGMQFYRFVISIRSGVGVPVVARPDAIEGFLPISGLLGLKDWLVQGTINPIHPAALVILLTVLVGALLLKRAFCSWICPIGTLSELLWKCGFSLFKGNLRPPLWLDRVLRAAKYLLLFFFLYLILWSMSPEQVAAFISSDYNKTADIRLLAFFLHLSLTGLTVLGLLMLASLPMRNPFCRYLCPYGALLGLLSILSPVKVTRDQKVCVGCGACTQVCPAYIPVMQKERVVSEECIGCWRCISHCRAPGALEMKLTGKKMAVHGLLFAVLVVGVFWGGSIIGKASGHWHTAITRDGYIGLIERLK